MRQTRTSLELIAWTLGGALLVFYLGARLWAAQAHAAGVEQMRAEMQTTDDSTASFPKATDQSLWSRERVDAYAVATRQAGGPEALLRIPALSLEVPVYGSVSEVNLNRGAGLIDGVKSLTKIGNVGIAAHRDGYFRALKDVTLDADVYLDFRGKTQRYRIVDLRIVSPEDNSVLAPSAVPTITLVTCYPFYFVGSAPQRFIVRAELDDIARSTSPRDSEQIQVNNWREP